MRMHTILVALCLALVLPGLAAAQKDARHAVGDSAQDRVALGMSEGVVDGLETIDVDQ